MNEDTNDFTILKVNESNKLYKFSKSAYKFNLFLLHHCIQYTSNEHDNKMNYICDFFLPQPHQQFQQGLQIKGIEFVEISSEPTYHWINVK
jgi:hypothetical protein